VSGTGGKLSAVAIVRIPVLFLARLAVEVLRGLTEALGGLLHALGGVLLRLVGAAALAVIAYAALLRALVHVWLPAVVWLPLAGAALAATLAWLVGGCLMCLAHPRLFMRRLTDPGREGGVDERRIREWEAAWRRALLYQQHQHAPGGERQASDDQGEHAWYGRPARSPYDILGVEPGATPEQIRAAYRELALRVHPDRNPGFVPEATQRFMDIQAAYELLSDPTSRPAHPQTG
jgi:DnaJ domain